MAHALASTTLTDSPNVSGHFTHCWDFDSVLRVVNSICRCTNLFNFWPVREFLVQFHTAKTVLWGVVFTRKRQSLSHLQFERGWAHDLQTVEVWNSVEVPSCRGSSRWINGCVDNRCGFGGEDDSNAGEVGERELVLVFSVLWEAQGETWRVDGWPILGAQLNLEPSTHVICAVWSVQWLYLWKCCVWQVSLFTHPSIAKEFAFWQAKKHLWTKKNHCCSVQDEDRQEFQLLFDFQSSCCSHWFDEDEDVGCRRFQLSWRGRMCWIPRQVSLWLRRIGPPSCSRRILICSFSESRRRFSMTFEMRDPNSSETSLPVHTWPTDNDWLDNKLSSRDW